MLNGVDVSDFQRTIDWAKAKAAGVQFAYAQASYGCGEDFLNYTFGGNHDRARAADLPFGAYHFFLFSQDPVAQAKAFLGAAKDRLGTLLPMVDVESDSGDPSSVEVGIARLSAFVAHVEAVIGKRIMIYTGPGYWNDAMGGSDAFAGHPLWVAHYTQDAQPELPRGWTDWAVWQHTSGLIVNGIPGYVDSDRCPNLAVITR